MTDLDSEEKRRDLEQHLKRAAAQVTRAVILCLAIALLAWASGRDRSLSEGHAADATSVPTQPTNGDLLIKTSIADISGLIPNLTTDTASHEITDTIFEGRVSLDDNVDSVDDRSIDAHGV